MNISNYDNMFFVLCVLTIVVYSKNYCAAECTKGVYENKVPPEDERFIVDKHNRLRLLIAQGKLDGQPRGVNLKRFKYSADLARKAQEIANTCVYGHKGVTLPQWNWVGQNIYQFKFSDYEKATNWEKVIQDWWDEYKKYKFGSGFSEATGHYTQLAWANTDHVGCGYAHYPIDGDTFKFEKFYVCNYGPGDAAIIAYYHMVLNRTVQRITSDLIWSFICHYDPILSLPAVWRDKLQMKMKLTYLRRNKFDFTCQDLNRASSGAILVDRSRTKQATVDVKTYVDMIMHDIAMVNYIIK